MKSMNQRRRKTTKQRHLLALPKELHWNVLSALLADLEHTADRSLVTALYGAVRARDWDLYKGVSDTWGLQSSRPEQSVSLVEAHQLLCRCLSKFTTSSDATALHCVALDRFEQVDCEVVRPRISKATRIRLSQVVRAIVGTVPSLDRVFNHCQHGPGSTSSHPYKLRFPFFKWKQLPYRMSSSAWPMFDEALSYQTAWRDACDLEVRQRLGLKIYDPLPQSVLLRSVSETTESNIVTTVPKDRSKRRTIAKEPVFNMYLQLGIHSLLEKRLERATGISIHDVTPSRQLARLGSMCPNGYLSPATIDLSEASDRLSLELVTQVFPADWVDLLVSTRSLYSELPMKSIRLAKYASMGNGTTFIVQTIIFYALCVLAQERADRFHPELTRVFGDDIILPSGSFTNLYVLLRECGLVVNREKSFHKGPVRETCGVDFFKGHNVRPVFFRRPYDDDLAGYLSFRNLLWLWSQETGLDLPETLELLDSYLDVPSLPASQALTSGKFDSYHVPLRERVEFEQLIWTAAQLSILDSDAAGTGFLFGRLCAKRSPEGSAFIKGVRQAQVRRDRKSVV